MILYGLIPQMPWQGPPLPRILSIDWKLVMPPHLGPPLPRTLNVRWTKEKIMKRE